MKTNSNEIEDAKIESLSERMDRIIAAEERWQRAKVLMDILYEEMGLKDSTDPKALGIAVRQRHEQYMAAQKEFADIRKMGNIDPNEDQGRAGKRLQSQAKVVAEEGSEMHSMNDRRGGI